MQQYFSDINFNTGDIVPLDKDSFYHLKKVLRKDSNYTFRLVNNENIIYHCHLYKDNLVKIDEKLDENNELDVDITCILSLIKSDKFELCIQKLVELGVKKIIPLNTSRCVFKLKDTKLERFQKIALEASEQSHRNIVPTIDEPIYIKDLGKYKSDKNYLCYESEKSFNNKIENTKSITYIIGPEGGFSDDEYKKIVDQGYESISLGKRILRAETAAIYITSVIVGNLQ